MKKNQLTWATCCYARCFLILIACANILHANENDDLAFVLKVLQTPPSNPNVSNRHEEHAQDLKRLGDSALPLLARYLQYWDNVGHDALFTMLAIDQDKAMPFIFNTLPGRTHESVQEWAFRMYNYRLLKGEALHGAKIIHDAAVRCLDYNNQEVSPIETLYALGLTGSKEDYALLEKRYNYYHEKAETAPRISANHYRKIANAAEAALARLGHSKYLDNIETKLKQTVPLPAESEKLVDWIGEAGFSGNERFVPLLCKHLHDPHTPPMISDLVWLFSQVPVQQQQRR
jgi:hypothetical protein